MRPKVARVIRVSDEPSPISLDIIPRKIQLRTKLKRPTENKNIEENSTLQLQYFLASLCDLQPSISDVRRLGLRYADTPEVHNILSKLRRPRSSSADLTRTHPNVLFSVLKEIFLAMPPIFESEEFLCLSRDAPQELVQCYLNELLDSISTEQRQLAYLLCRSLHHLVRLSSLQSQSLTDVLVVFTPILFPRCKKCLEPFIRATRATLFMIENTAEVFQRHLTAREEEESVIDQDVLESLDRLNVRLSDEDFASDDSSSSEEDEELLIIQTQREHQPHYYTLTYMDE